MIKTFEAFKKDSFEMPKAHKKDEFTLPDTPTEKLNKASMPTRSELKNCLINNPDIFYSVVTYYNGYTGTSFVAYNNEEGLKELFHGFEDDEIISKLLHGTFSKDNKFVGFDDDGNVVSFDNIQDHIDVNDVLIWMMKHPQDLDIDVWAEIIECTKR